MNDKELFICEKCKLEAARTEEDVLPEYKQRLDETISRAVIIPYCKPYVEGGRHNQRMWIDTQSVALEEGFSFYHHSYDEVLSYSIDNRGESELLLDDMSGVYVDEYYAPNNKGKVYFISSNGNHRMLVYKAIGIPEVCANVQVVKDDLWRYYAPNIHSFHILRRFAGIGLVEPIEMNESNPELIFRSYMNIVPWILPTGNTGLTKFGALKEMKKRLKIVDECYGPFDESVIKKIDRVILRTTFDFIYYFG